MITHPPATVTKQRYELYKRFVADEDMPADIREAAVFYFEKYKVQKDVGESMAGELVWQLICFAAADPMHRMEMVMRGKTFHAQKMWEELEKQKKRERSV